MIRTEIHLAVSLNEHFAVMCEVLLRSIERRAALPGSWRVVFNVSRDAPASSVSTFAWAEAYPVEFRTVPRDLWDRFGYDGTGLQATLVGDSPADVVLWMDADTVVAGSLADVVREAAGSDAFHARPAWFPPPVSLERALDAAGLAWPGEGVTLAGHGIDFLSPQLSPPYFNAGFAVLCGALAGRISGSIQQDFEFVAERFRNPFVFQVALCLNIVRKRHRFVVLDERYNLGNGDSCAPMFHDAESLERRGRLMAAMTDARLLHYCVATDAFQKTRDMATWEAVRAFCAKPGLGDGHALLQTTLRDLVGA